MKHQIHGAFFVPLNWTTHALNNLNLISESRVHALNLIDGLDHQTFLYHDRYHTEQVARITELLGKEEDISDDSLEHLCIAAWFHDTGYSDISHHEQQSAIYANTFLREKKLDTDSIDSISRVIMATKISHHPIAADEQIIRDADLHYLGLENYEERAKLLRLEWERCLNRTLTDREWYLENIKFFESHKFYTASAQKHFNETKALNLKKIKSLLSTT